MKFSVDMIRLVARVPLLEYGQFYSKYIPNNPNVSQYIRGRIQDYHYNFAVDELSDFEQLDENNKSLGHIHNTFYVGYQHNQEKIMDNPFHKCNMVIEFNPNKCDIRYGLLNKVLTTFFYNVNNLRVVSADFCCDIPDVTLDNVTIDRKLKRTFIDYQSNGGRGFYIGKRGSNGQVKIYDKAKELGLKDKVLTRYECHLMFDDLYVNSVMAHGFKISPCLPKVIFDSGQYGLIDDVKLRCCVMAVKNGYADIKEFNPRFRQKIMPYLEDTAKFIIDDTCIVDLHSCIIEYFYNYCKDLQLHY